MAGFKNFSVFSVWILRGLRANQMNILLSILLITIPHLLSSQNIFLSGDGYEKHNEVRWNDYTPADRYEIWRKGPGEDQFSKITTTQDTLLLDWTDNSATIDQPYDYFIQALNVPGAIIQQSDTITLIQSIMSDEAFLDMTQLYTLRYFYDYGHPTSGMARERLGSGDIVTTGGTGFGIMALVVGVHRGFITRDQGVNRILKIISFLQFADRFHGVFPHWMNGKTGDAIPFSTFDDGGDLVETAFLMQGLLAARAYFDRDTPKENAIRDVITGLWEDVEWDHYSRNNSGVLYWHWSPNHGWQMNFQIRGYNEALIVYLLAIASPTHAVDPSYYHDGWAGGNYVNGNSWYGYKLFVGPHVGGPLFFAHYSYLGFDPRDKKDAYANYFLQNKHHTLINRGWCIANPFQHEGYDENTWGLTASDDPFGYRAHAPAGPSDNGTITPAAGIPSMPYTPTESITLLKDLYRTYGAELWGEYGFYDAFNLNENWFADSYLAIDQGPIIDMIENYRSGLLWNRFMANEEIQPALDAIGFVPDSLSAAHDITAASNWRLYPTIARDEIVIEMPDHNVPANITVIFSDIAGRVVSSSTINTSSSQVTLSVPAEINSGSWIWVTLTHPAFVNTTKAIWIP
jgi:hypothetical protein